MLHVSMTLVQGNHTEMSHTRFRALPSSSSQFKPHAESNTNECTLSPFLHHSGRMIVMIVGIQADSDDYKGNPHLFLPWHHRSCMCQTVETRPVALQQAHNPNPYWLQWTSNTCPMNIRVRLEIVSPHSVYCTTQGWNNGTKTSCGLYDLWQPVTGADDEDCLMTAFRKTACKDSWWAFMKRNETDNNTLKHPWTLPSTWVIARDANVLLRVRDYFFYCMRTRMPHLEYHSFFDTTCHD